MICGFLMHANEHNFTLFKAATASSPMVEVARGSAVDGVGVFASAYMFTRVNV